MAVLNELHEKMLRIILERSEIPDLANVPGGQNGLVTKTLKGLGSGDNFKVVEEYEVDCATVRNICFRHDESGASRRGKQCI